MSAASRWRKAEARRRARWHARRARILEAQIPLAGRDLTPTDVALLFYVGRAFVCDGERVAVEWCRHHQPALPRGLGQAYRARHRRSW